MSDPSFRVAAGDADSSVVLDVPHASVTVPGIERVAHALTRLIDKVHWHGTESAPATT